MYNDVDVKKLKRRKLFSDLLVGTIIGIVSCVIGTSILFFFAYIASIFS